MTGGTLLSAQLTVAASRIEECVWIAAKYARKIASQATRIEDSHDPDARHSRKTAS